MSKKNPNPTLRSNSILFVGHISTDKVENINGTRTQPGGAALYAAIAAKALNARPALVSAIGKDFPFTECFSGLDSISVRTLNMPTTRFHIRYNRKWEADYLQINIGAGVKISPSMIPSRLLKPQSLVHISPMKPTKVARIVENIRRRAPNIKISMSTWIGYMKKTRQRRLLAKLASQVDFFMLNEFEAKALSQADSLSFALERVKARRLIVTMGKLGAIMSGPNIEPQMVPALNIPTNKVVDTTGAGDAWQGAFLASYHMTNDLLKSVTVASIISSIKCSQWGFKAIQGLSFKKPSDVISYVLALKEGWMQKRITDFIRMQRS